MHSLIPKTSYTISNVNVFTPAKSDSHSKQSFPIGGFQSKRADVIVPGSHDSAHYSTVIRGKSDQIDQNVSPAKITDAIFAQASAVSLSSLTELTRGYKHPFLITPPHTSPHICEWQRGIKDDTQNESATQQARGGISLRSRHYCFCCIDGQTVDVPQGGKKKKRTQMPNVVVFFFPIMPQGFDFRMDLNVRNRTRRSQ